MRQRVFMDMKCHKWKKKKGKHKYLLFDLQYLYQSYIVMDSPQVSLSEKKVHTEAKRYGNNLTRRYGFAPGNLPAAAAVYDNRECTSSEDHRQSSRGTQKK